MADALSRVEGSEILHMAMTVLECDLLQQIQAAYQEDVQIQEIIEALQRNPKAKKHFVWSLGVLRWKQRIVVPKYARIRKTILEWLHGSGQSGHSGRDVTVQRVKRIFYWKGLAKDVQAFVRAYGVLTM